MPDIITVTIAAVASFLGAFTQRVSGFGYGIVVMMFFPHIMKNAEANAISGAISILLAASVLLSLWKKVNLRQVIIPLIPYTVTSYIGTAIVKGSDTSLLKRILGAFLVVLSIYFFIFASKIKIKANTRNAVAAGGLSGILSGLFAIGGPPVVVYYLSATDSTDEYLATIQCFFLFSNIVASVQRAAAGAFTEKALWLLIPCAATMIIANFLGGKVYSKLDPTTVKKVIYGFMAFSGIIALLGI